MNTTELAKQKLLEVLNDVETPANVIVQASKLALQYHTLLTEDNVEHLEEEVKKAKESIDKKDLAKIMRLRA